VNCSVNECDKPVVNRKGGLCEMHRTRLRRHGSVDGFAQPKERRPGFQISWLIEHVGHTGDDCLIFPGSLGNSGRGAIHYAGKQQSLARVMCILAHGEPPFPRADSAHSCGNGHLGCVHPKHLSWKTRKANLADMVEHGTVPRGEKCGTSKLTRDQVVEIRALRGRVSVWELGEKFGVSGQQISRIHRRERWEHFA
jgi:hypothetical protein